MEADSVHWSLHVLGPKPFFTDINFSLPKTRILTLAKQETILFIIRVPEFYVNHNYTSEALRGVYVKVQKSQWIQF